MAKEPSRRITIAVAHSVISADVRENGAHIRALMGDAAAAEARLIHFPEGAASGYVKSQIKDWAKVDWPALRDELEQIAARAAELHLWTVIGSNHRLGAPHRPHNSVYVISERGRIEGRYDKRFCSHTEITDWYTPGFEPLTFAIDELLLGCSICIEISFADIFDDYRHRGVHCVLHSSYSNDPLDEIKARAHASLNNFWFSLAVPANGPNPIASAIYGPDGRILVQTEPGKPSIATTEIDLEDERWHGPLRFARSWRARARSGEIYRERQVNDERSDDKQSF